METAGKPLSTKTTDLSPSSSPRRKRGVHSNPSESCFRQGKSLCPGSSRSRRCLFPRHFGWWLVVSHRPGIETGRGRRGVKSSSQKDGVGHVDEGVGRLGGGVAHVGVWWVCRWAMGALASGSLTVVEFVCKSGRKDIVSGRWSFLLNDVDLWQLFSIFFPDPPTQTRFNAKGDGEVRASLHWRSP